VAAVSADHGPGRASVARITAQRLPPPTVDQWSWQARGLCRDYPAELFFPEEESRRHRRAREDSAKRICLDCPVMVECRRHALSIPEVYGVWGAMTAAERSRRDR
jgi:WhiB family redox-sensing transcriptional regulator